MALGVVSLLLAGFDLATVDLPSRLAELESSARASFPSLSGEPSIEFPTGFPLIDGEVVERDVTPGASEDQIAMLKRVMGGE